MRVVNSFKINEFLSRESLVESRVEWRTVERSERVYPTPKTVRFRRFSFSFVNFNDISSIPPSLPLFAKKEVSICQKQPSLSLTIKQRHFE